MMPKLKHIAIFLQAMLILIAAVGYVRFDDCCSDLALEQMACCADEAQDKSCAEKSEAEKENCCIVDGEYKKLTTENVQITKGKTAQLAFLDDVWLLPIKLYLYIQLFFDYPQDSNQSITISPPPPKAGRAILIEKQVLRI